MNSKMSEGRVGGSNESAAGVLATELPVGRGAWRDAGPAGGDAGGSACIFHEGGKIAEDDDARLQRSNPLLLPWDPRLPRVDLFVNPYDLSLFLFRP